MTTLDLTGDWAGHYVQDGARQRITMQVVQSGTTFGGTMRDLDTTPTSLVPMDNDPGAGFSGPVAAVVHHELPEYSVIAGTVAWTNVTMVQQYQGTTKATVHAHGHAVAHHEAPGHVVLYSGTVDPGTMKLTGTWTIPAPSGGVTHSDRFELLRTRRSATP